MKFLLIPILLSLVSNKLLSYPLTRSDHLVEGDIRIKNKNARSLGSSMESNKWPDGIVPYTIDPGSGYSTSEKEVIISAMNLITKKTEGCIQFVPREASHRKWLTIKSLDGCWSFIGKQDQDGEQEISLSRNGCIFTGTAVHELCHALGFWHEQNRPDRDSYIKISFENIVEGMAGNFDVYKGGQYFTTPYDYESIMHYASYAFSKNTLPTITPLKPGVHLVPSYSRTDEQILSMFDILAIRNRYKCFGTGLATTSSTLAPKTTTVTLTTVISMISNVTVLQTNTTTPGECLNVDLTCDYYYSNRETYCDERFSYFLNHLKFADGKLVVE